MLHMADIGLQRGRAALIVVLLGGLTGLMPPSALAVTSVNFAWTPSASTNITGYTIYYGGASHTYTNSIAVGTATNATVPGLTDGVTYYFAATAVDDAGLESEYSNEASNAPPVVGALPPTISAISDQSTIQDTPTAPIFFVIGDAVTAASSLTLYATSSQTGLVPVNNIVFGGSDSNRIVTITPASGQSGESDITVTVSDGVATASTTFAFTVVAQRPPPVVPPTISTIASITITQNCLAPTIPFTIGDAQAAADTLTLWATSTNANLLPRTGILFGGSNSNRTVTLTPVSGQTGCSDIIVYVSDGSAISSTAFHLTVLTASTGPQPALRLLVSGSGKISPNLTSQKLTMGRLYGISAVPAPGQMFCGWAGSLTSSLQNVSFIMKSNLVFQANFAPLNLARSGLGSFSPDPRLSQNLIAGKTYTITAVPGAGQVFAGWSGMTTSSAPRITFLISTNVNLQANFIPSPFLPIQGTYSGLFHEETAVRAESAGFFTISVSSRGGYSGSLQLGARHLTLSGQLNLECQATRLISLTPSNTLTLSLRFGTGDQTDKVFGTLTDGTWISALAGDRAVFNSRTKPAPFAGSYTLVLPGSDGDPTLPAGDSYGTVLVSAGGLASFSGTLADGTAVSQSASVSKDGFWPLYVPVYSGQGVLISWLAFTNQPDSDIDGLLSWIKPALSNAQHYAAGFTQQCQAIGSAYVRPARACTLDLNLTNANLAFSGGALSASFTNCIVVGQLGRLINEGTNALTVSFSLLTGTFTGHVTDPATRKSVPFGGVVFQKQNAGYGFLLGTNQSSQVNLLP
jgi:hypothetical protein